MVDLYRCAHMAVCNPTLFTVAFDDCADIQRLLRDSVGGSFTKEFHSLLRTLG